MCETMIYMSGVDVPQDVSLYKKKKMQSPPNTNNASTSTSLYIKDGDMPSLSWILYHKNMPI